MGQAGSVGVVTETVRSPVVECLLERGFPVHSINPSNGCGWMPTALGSMFPILRKSLVSAIMPRVQLLASTGWSLAKPLRLKMVSQLGSSARPTPSRWSSAASGQRCKRKRAQRGLTCPRAEPQHLPVQGTAPGTSGSKAGRASLPHLKRRWPFGWGRRACRGRDMPPNCQPLSRERLGIFLETISCTYWCMFCPRVWFWAAKGHVGFQKGNRGRLSVQYQ